MFLLSIMGIAILTIIVSCIVISFYFRKREEFKKKEDFYERLERKTKEQNEGNG